MFLRFIHVGKPKTLNTLGTYETVLCASPNYCKVGHWGGNLLWSLSKEVGGPPDQSHCPTALHWTPPSAVTSSFSFGFQLVWAKSDNLVGNESSQALNFYAPAIFTPHATSEIFYAF